MSIEIERKFLVKNDAFKDLAQAEIYHQGFLSTNKERVVRVRISDQRAWLTIKGISEGATRQEFEYEIPVGDAKYIIDKICKKPTILKKRYRISIDEFIWEVDEFLDENQGLVLAEIELARENQEIKLPIWIGKEVTANKKYYNAYLVKHPFNTWK